MAVYAARRPASPPSTTCRRPPRVTARPARRCRPDDSARFVNVQLLNGPDGYVYVWGTEGGANNDASPVYLERIPAAHIATGRARVLDAGQARGSSGSQQRATPLFKDHPAPCMAQFGIEHDPLPREWIMLYHCKQSTQPHGHPNGIFMRTAPHPWGPWSAPTTIFNPAPDGRTAERLLLLHLLHPDGQPEKPNGYPNCPTSSPNALLADAEQHLGSYYGAYFVANWATGNRQTLNRASQPTFYYTLDTFDPYGQLIMRTTVLGPPVTIVKPPPPTCRGTKCM